MFRLDERHLAKAREIAARNRIKPKCNICYDRGYIGVNQNNTLILCLKCVDTAAAFEEWKRYIVDFPELREYYAEYLAEKEELEGEHSV
ncbi:MAG: hypothetical protein JW784_06115 [Candidatus Cloacimonetes bacterium]|nr:hypothetical protein [Candidatus Cloacimonadota bacterium]